MRWILIACRPQCSVASSRGSIAERARRLGIRSVAVLRARRCMCSLCSGRLRYNFSISVFDAPSAIEAGLRACLVLRGELSVCRHIKTCHGKTTLLWFGIIKTS